MSAAPAAGVLTSAAAAAGDLAFRQSNMEQTLAFRYIKCLTRFFSSDQMAITNIAGVTSCSFSS